MKRRFIRSLQTAIAVTLIAATAASRAQPVPPPTTGQPYEQAAAPPLGESGEAVSEQAGPTPQETVVGATPEAPPQGWWERNVTRLRARWNSITRGLKDRWAKLRETFSRFIFGDPTPPQVVEIGPRSHEVIERALGQQSRVQRWLESPSVGAEEGQSVPTIGLMEGRPRGIQTLESIERNALYMYLEYSRFGGFPYLKGEYADVRDRTELEHLHWTWSVLGEASWHFVMDKVFSPGNPYKTLSYGLLSQDRVRVITHEVAQAVHGFLHSLKTGDEADWFRPLLDRPPMLMVYRWDMGLATGTVAAADTAQSIEYVQPEDFARMYVDPIERKLFLLTPQQSSFSLEDLARTLVLTQDFANQPDWNPALDGRMAEARLWVDWTQDQLSRNLPYAEREPQNPGIFGHFIDQPVKVFTVDISAIQPEALWALLHNLAERIEGRVPDADQMLEAREKFVGLPPSHCELYMTGGLGYGYRRQIDPALTYAAPF